MDAQTKEFEVVLPEVKVELVENADYTFALNFSVKDADALTQEYIDALMAKYGKHYVDYVLTIEGLTVDKVVFNANGEVDGYLGGQYDAWGTEWVKVPFENTEIKNGESLYIMETAAKIWEAETPKGEISITPIIEFLNNIKFLASAYNQMWVIKKMVLNGEDTIAFVDDVTGLKKMIIFAL